MLEDILENMNAMVELFCKKYNVPEDAVKGIMGVFASTVFISYCNEHMEETKDLMKQSKEALEYSEKKLEGLL